MIHRWHIAWCQVPALLFTILATAPSVSAGNAVKFDGMNDYIKVNNSASLQDVTDESFTWSAWVKPQDIPPTTCSTNNNTCNYAAITRPGNHLAIGYSQKQRFFTDVWTVNVWNSAHLIHMESAITAPGTWHHLCLVVDNVAKKVYWYLDGAQVTGSPATYTEYLRDYGTVPYYIGAANPTSGEYTWRFKGAIDEVRVYSRALSATEVSAQYNGGLGQQGAPESGLAGGWHLDETSGTSAADYSGNGNTGTLFNGPTWVPGLVSSAPPSDTTPPTGSVTINGGAAATNATAATLTLSATDNVGVTQMKFSNDGTTYSASEPYAASKTWTLSAGDSTKTVSVKFIDAAGNTSAAAADTIVLDTTPPQLTITSPANGSVVTP